MPRIEKHLHILQELGYKNKNKGDIQKIISDSDTDFLLSISELVFNIVRGNVPITGTQLTQLKKYENSVVDLSNKKTSANVRRKLLIGLNAKFFSLLHEIVTEYLGSGDNDNNEAR